MSKTIRKFQDFQDPHEISNDAFARALGCFTPDKKTEGVVDEAVVSTQLDTTVAQKPATSVVVPIVSLKPSKKEGKTIPPAEKEKAVVTPPPNAHANEKPHVKAHPKPKSEVNTVSYDKPSWKDWIGTIKVWELLHHHQSVLWERIKVLKELGVPLTFAFYFDDEDFTGLSMSITTDGDSVKLEAVRAIGKLAERFPKGMTLSLGELRGTADIPDLNRRHMASEFGRVMQMLCNLQYAALSHKLSEANRKSHR